ncbi:MAG: Mini-ribonuclease 3 [Christensenellales bacterium]
MFNDLIEQNKNKDKINLMDVLALAFVGDAVHSLYVRTVLVGQADFKQKDLQAKTSEIVRASNQSKTLAKIEGVLTEDEKGVMLRARNAHTNNKAKNSTLQEYKRSTAFEAIIGYLYLQKKFERMNMFLSLSMNDIK